MGVNRANHHLELPALVFVGGLRPVRREAVLRACLREDSAETAVPVENRSSGGECQGLDTRKHNLLLNALARLCRLTRKAPARLARHLLQHPAVNRQADRGLSVTFENCRF
jgi:hypothetical protein